MSYHNGGSRSGSRDNLDEIYDQRYGPRQPPGQPQAPPRAVPRTSQSSVQTPTQARGGYERQYAPGPPRSDVPPRYSERPQDQYMPSRSHSPDSFAGSRRDDEHERYGAQRRRDRSQSPARTLDEPYRGHSIEGRSNAGYNQYSPHQLAAGYKPSQPAPGYSGGYQPRPPHQPNHPNLQPPQPRYGGRGRNMYESKPPVRNYQGYQPMQDSKNGRYAKGPKKTVTRDGGYYNVYTDAIVKTKKYKTKTGASTFISVIRPWSKNHSNQPRDFMPLVIAAMFFNPLFGLAALVLSCMTRSAVTSEDWARAGLYGRITFWLSIAAIILGIIFWMVLIAAVHNGFIVPKLH